MIPEYFSFPRFPFLLFKLFWILHATMSPELTTPIFLN